MSKTTLMRVLLCLTIAGCGPLGGTAGTTPNVVARPLIPPRAPTYQLLYGFKGVPDGVNPEMGLVVMGDKLYGTTYNGGAYGQGSVFEITTRGREKVIYSFRATEDGSNPYAGLTAVNGLLYGVTTSGGGGHCHYGNYGYGSGCGTVFSVDASGNERILYRFHGTTDGSTPQTNLVELNGWLYGTSTFGGGGTCKVLNGCGTVFKVSPSGVFRTVYHFKGGGAAGDGDVPIGNLTYLNGAFYGTTVAGGSKWEGTVYAVSPTGAEKVLYAFRGGNDGASPRAGLIAVDGSLYGVTFSGAGTACTGGRGCGTVFSITTTGTEKIRQRFGNGSEGGNPYENLTNVDGVLYGTTTVGGSVHCSQRSLGCGTLFAIDENGTYDVLHEFGGVSDGAVAQGQLVELKGALYGTTFIGGSHDSGTIYKIAL
ncbi:MAG TPA: choice-of-anchor tandem repeat GloVer-containing protein [Candidatus Baltobacteraceae bacterium]|jgi:uncharacterized repeat protein (TIGR03803 family)